MTKKQKEALLDMASFLKWAVEEDYSFTGALNTLGHDISGLFNEDDKFFLPRTHGYAKKTKN